jgi:hypothetical protein
MIDELESGGKPYPLFFAGVDCSSGQWPIDTTFFDQTKYGSLIQAATICPNSSKLICPVPITVSMAFGPNLRIKYFANDTSSGVASRIQELGETNFYTSDPTFANSAHISNMVTHAGVLTWYSKQCNGEPNGCTQLGQPANCKTPTTQPFDSDVSTPGRLLKSMISCNSTLWPSFTGINTLPFIDGTPDANWSLCRTLPNAPDPSTLPPAFQDYCIQGNSATIEKLQYQTQWFDAAGPCQVTSSTFFQACSCLATQTEAKDSETSKEYNLFLPPTGSCGNNYCGTCVATFTHEDQDKVILPCVCTEDVTTVKGSVKQIQVDFVNDDNKVINWEELQVLWCTKGVSIANIPITRYSSGSPTCDSVMIAACSNTASLTVDLNLTEQCTCVNENKVLQARFSSIDIPSQCFSSVCNIANNTDVYKLHSQLSGCNARLCEQTLSIHGSFIFTGSSQTVICNGQIYSITDVPNVSPVPLISVVQPVYGQYNIATPTFFIVLGVLVMLVIVCILWGVRTIRSKTRDKKIAQEQFESKLNKNSLE